MNFEAKIYHQHSILLKYDSSIYYRNIYTYNKMTEQLAKDVEILDTTEKSGRDLAAILGLDIDDKSFVLQMTPFYGNDTKSISSGGGITVKPNQ